MSRSIALIACIASLFTFAQAWLPNDGSSSITNRDGVNIFERQTQSLWRGQGRRWLDTSFGKARGVNLGSLFVIEPWILSKQWDKMGCGGLDSEWDCVKKLGQEKADQVFRKHWETFITAADFDEMRSYGLNTVRIPVGYWIYEKLVKAGEYFPRGGLPYLLKVCDWASARGFYIIIDLHGAPGVQAANNAFTGHFVSPPGFYTSDNYARGVEFLAWLAELALTKPELRNVGMISVLNEGLANGDAKDSLRSEFYPKAYKAIRAAEAKHSSRRLHVQFMNTQWGAGDPAEFLPAGYTDVAFDDHRYVKWDETVAVTHEAYLRDACTNSRGGRGETPTLVTEWSVSPPDAVQWSEGWHPDRQRAFYRDWFAALASRFERDTAGWTFWTWKSELGDYRWSYRDAVAAGVIPKDLDSLKTTTVCKPYT